MCLRFLSRNYCNLLDHDLMASIWEKDISILAGNLNPGRSYFITAVLNLYFNFCLTIQCWFNFVIAFLFLFFQSRILASELNTSSGVRHFNRRNVQNTMYSIVPIRCGSENKRVRVNFADDLISVLNQLNVSMGFSCIFNNRICYLIVSLWAFRWFKHTLHVFLRNQ